jgi:MoxR-like ATPase
VLRLSVGYPSRDDEQGIVARRLERGSDEVSLSAVSDAEELRQMQAAIEGVHVAEVVTAYAVDIVRATRSSPRLQIGASPRGTLALVKLARCRAAVHGRDYVTPDDVKAIAVPALEHRLSLKPELWVQQLRGATVVEEALSTVPTPPAEDLAPKL